jgi:CDGSH-type Zn-finger protein
VSYGAFFRGTGSYLCACGPSSLKALKDWRHAAKSQLFILKRMYSYPHLCSFVACDWCGAEMHAIAPIETGMARGRGLTYLCRCGHELEVLGRAD